MVKSVPQHFEKDVSSNVSADWLARLGIPAQTSMIGPRMDYREGRPFMNRWIYVFSPNDWGHLEAAARWSKICTDVQLSRWCEKAKGDLGKMPTAEGEKEKSHSVKYPPCSLIDPFSWTPSNPSHFGGQKLSPDGGRGQVDGRIEGDTEKKRAE